MLDVETSGATEEAIEETIVESNATVEAIDQRVVPSVETHSEAHLGPGLAALTADHVHLYYPLRC